MIIIKYIKTILIVSGIMLHQGCHQDFLSQTPDHVISETLVLGYVDKLEDLLTGSYNEISSASYLGRVLYKRAAVKGSDFRYVKTTYNPRSYELTEYKYEESSNNNGSAQVLWEKCYSVISNLNLILDYIDDAEGDDARRRQIKGEALALRGMVYFDLARTFTYPWIREGGSGLGLPINLTSKTIVTERSSLEATFDQIISDFNVAETLLSANSWSQGSTKYITPAGIHGLLARVYLYKQDWDNALKYCEQILAERDESYLMNIDGYEFTDFTSESIFELYVTSENSSGSNGLGAQFDFRLGGQGDVIATQTFIGLLNEYEGDPRAALLTEDKEGNTAAFVKYINRGEDAGLSNHNVPIIRLSEVFLIAAEACAHGAGDGEDEARQFLNSIVSRRTTNFDAHRVEEGGDALLSRIAKERRKELALEGHGVYDYIRRGNDILRPESDHVNTGINVNNLNIPATSPETIYPIPASEIEASGMIQTEGY